ncbi:hypothetical protein G9A89_001032 [Geosiphon pyriformis]|nr:hypothetical protein G9A89_001032 [Geosiphon pyriformis]
MALNNYNQSNSPNSPASAIEVNSLTPNDPRVRDSITTVVDFNISELRAQYGEGSISRSDTIETLTEKIDEKYLKKTLNPVSERIQKFTKASLKAIEVIEPPNHEFEDNTQVPKLSYLKVFLLFLKFGISSWGSSGAEVSFFKHEFVKKQAWISKKRFKRVYSVYNFLPGPISVELAMYFGCLTAGRLGGVLAGLSFILPGFLLTVLVSYFYVWIGKDNKYFNASFLGIQPMVAAMVLRAVHEKGSHAFISHKTKKFSYWLFAFAIISAIQSAFRMNFIIILVVLGLSYVCVHSKNYWCAIMILVIEMTCYTIHIAKKGLPHDEGLGFGVAKTSDPGHILGLGLLAGSISFGGGYAIIPILEAEVVIIGQWITRQTFLDALAVGNIVPGPLVLIATFLGFQGGNIYCGIGCGFLEAGLITIGIFLPCFIFTIIGHNLLERLSQKQLFRAFFDGMLASIVGTILVEALHLLKYSVSTPGSIRFVEDESQYSMVLAGHHSLAAKHKVFANFGAVKSVPPKDLIHKFATSYSPTALLTIQRALYQQARRIFCEYMKKL